MEHPPLALKSSPNSTQFDQIQVNSSKFNHGKNDHCISGKAFARRWTQIDADREKKSPSSASICVICGPFRIRLRLCRAVIFAVNSSWVPACSGGIFATFAHLRGNSTQIPFHEPFTH
jgi:hypothetical protein